VNRFPCKGQEKNIFMKTSQKINFFLIDGAFSGSLLCTRFTNRFFWRKTDRSQLNQSKKVNCVQFGDCGVCNGEILKAGNLSRIFVNLEKAAISLKFTFCGGVR